MGAEGKKRGTEEEGEGNRMETGRMLGKYRMIRPLGAGGEGCVYLAEDMGLSRLVAVKQIKENNARHGDGEEILLEAAFLRDLHHPMLPVVYDLFYENGWYLVMEYIKGISLHNYIERQGNVGEEKGRIWADALLDILQYLHSRKPPVIYRDLKPDNLMVCQDGKLRLVDLGAASLKSYSDSGDRQMALTLGYAAPEQYEGIDGRIYADERSDIYAFGRVAYYMFTGADPGKPPYGALPVRAYDPLLGAALEQMIVKCTREDPGERYQVVEEISRDLQKMSRQRGAGNQRNHRNHRRRDFIRHIEKKVWLTDKGMDGLGRGVER